MSEETEDRVVWRKELTEKLGYCSDTIRRQMRAKKLPAPDVQHSRQRIGWKLSTLKAAGLPVA